MLLNGAFAKFVDETQADKSAKCTTNRHLRVPQDLANAPLNPTPRKRCHYLFIISPEESPLRSDVDGEDDRDGRANDDGKGVQETRTHS